ncbi:MAG TPA: hypothetical protein VG983_04535 [Caulobacterales bacterium]|jgi:hypothetical protein|nr:hypothetical protein [Caulobacterales bacterium]
MVQRGWTRASIDEAIAKGQHHPAVNNETGGPAARYIHPVTGRSVVIDDQTNEVLHVGGDGFIY